MKLRAHHLLCIPMYQGKGYSEGFCSHMEDMIGRIKAGEAEFLISASPDDICAGCPHLCSDSGGLACEEEKKISQKDMELTMRWKMQGGRVYKRPEMKNMVIQNMSEEVFRHSCGNCEWLEKGLCSYSLWKEKFDQCFL